MIDKQTKIITRTNLVIPLNVRLMDSRLNIYLKGDENP